MTHTGEKRVKKIILGRVIKKNVWLLMGQLLLLATFTCAYALPGFYVQGQIGWGGMHTKSYEADGVILNKVRRRGFSSAAGRVAFGYLWKHRAWDYGVEAGWGTYSQNEYNTNIGSVNRQYKGYNVDLLLALQYNFNPKWDVEIKGGTAYVMQNFEQNRSQPLNIDSSQLRPEAAAGIGYHLSKRLSAHLDYHHIFAHIPDPLAPENTDKTQIASVDAIMLGLRYHFV